MPLLWEKLIQNAERTMESKCNTIRAECGLPMCTGSENCIMEPCLVKCNLRPLNDRTLQEASQLYQDLATGVE